ncbi:MAG: hypothetical protein KW788_03730 [Candidatus Doudnabacteria bacterium]|nr:hypothetical protein [Candidatus Doudnabacteria bacterium]
MDDICNKLAKEISVAIGDLVEKSAEIERIRERARKEGFEIKLSLEAEIGFITYTRVQKDPLGAKAGQKCLPPASSSDSSSEFNAPDKKWLRSLRISSGDDSPVIDT